MGRLRLTAFRDPDFQSFFHSSGSEDEQQTYDQLFLADFGAFERLDVLQAALKVASAATLGSVFRDHFIGF